VPPATGGSVLVVAAPIARADVQPLCDELRVRLEASDADRVVCDVGAVMDPDVGAVDAVARLALTARRFGRRIGLVHAPPELQDLLALAGLADVVPCGAESAVEPKGQAEERKELWSVEEERNPADPTA